LPILQKLSDDPYGVFALVLTPTRELAFQMADQFTALGKPIHLKVSTVVGGREMVAQALDISRLPHVIVATPGRLADHIESGAEVKLGRVRFLVLDEADRLLGGQYDDQLETIFGKLPKDRQTLLFSATITDALNRLQELAIRKPFFWEDTADVATVSSLEQRYVLCPADVKDAYLVFFIKQFHERHPESAIIIFSHTCRECQALAIMFRELGFKRFGALHSMVPQRERLEALSKFRSGTKKVLVCTDVASRGLDIPAVQLVVNHNVPAVPKNYVHRVGRAARAGRSGKAVTFLTQYDIGLLQAIEAQIGTELKELKISPAKVSKHVTEVLVAKREAEVKLDESGFGEKREINRKKHMILAGIDPEEADKFMERLKDRQQRSTSKRKTDRSLASSSSAGFDNQAKIKRKKQN
jgi:ATP-dependent RNA helicase DDX49/DBP8